MILNADDGFRWRMVAYIGPMVVGAIGIAFMIKPLFAPRGKRPPTHMLDPSEQPTLFRFVERLARAIGAPPPRRIDVDMDVNASASFRRGIRSMFGNDLVLTIGLPLVAGMSLQQLVAILSHEFGHFSQGVGMRMSYLIGSINRWFARVVYERDAWDEQLIAWSESSNFWAVSLILGLSRLFVWLTRGILRMLMLLGHGISCFMSRQMEFDADSYLTRVTGSDTFRNMHLRLTALCVAARGAHEDLRNSWREGRLGDDLPALMLANMGQFQAQPGAVQAMERQVLSEKTGFFDTHPSARDRIKAAERHGHRGIFHAKQPAKSLFRHFGELCKHETIRYYRDMMDLKVTLQSLVPTEKLVAEQTALQDAHQSLLRYFHGPWLGANPLFLPAEAAEASPDPEQTLQQLREAREQMLDHLNDLKQAAKYYTDGETQLQNANGNEENEQLVTEIQRIAANIRSRLADVLKTLSAYPYPFDDALGRVSLATYVAEKLPPADQCGAIGAICEDALDKLHSLYYRCIGQLTVAAEQVETAAGFQPLDDPPSEPDEA